MIITCPACEKKFQIDATLIPNEGRTLQCGSCGHQWFYKKKFDDKLNYLEEKLISKKNLSPNKIKRKSVKDQINIKKEKLDVENSFSNKRDTAIVKYEEKQNFTFTKFLGYILITILSFLAMIIEGMISNISVKLFLKRAVNLSAYVCSKNGPNPEYNKDQF